MRYDVLVSYSALVILLRPQYIIILLFLFVILLLTCIVKRSFEFPVIHLGRLQNKLMQIFNRVLAPFKR